MRALCSEYSNKNFRDNAAVSKEYKEIFIVACLLKKYAVLSMEAKKTASDL
jgi:hypothetical protein